MVSLYSKTQACRLCFLLFTNILNELEEGQCNFYYFIDTSLALKLVSILAIDTKKLFFGGSKDGTNLFWITTSRSNFLDKEILKIERLAIHQFDRIGIVGKNGAGKSTLLKLLAGIVQPAKGKIHRHIESGYFEQLEAPSTIEADVALLGKLGVPKDSHQLSGGEQTRLKLAQLFTHYYEALLIDEPTTHLDQEGISFYLMNWSITMGLSF